MIPRYVEIGIPIPNSHGYSLPWINKNFYLHTLIWARICIYRNILSLNDELMVCSMFGKAKDRGPTKPWLEPVLTIHRRYQLLQMVPGKQRAIILLRPLYWTRTSVWIALPKITMLPMPAFSSVLPRFPVHSYPGIIASPTGSIEGVMRMRLTCSRTCAIGLNLTLNFTLMKYPHLGASFYSQAQQKRFP